MKTQLCHTCLANPTWYYRHTNAQAIDLLIEKARFSADINQPKMSEKQGTVILKITLRIHLPPRKPQNPVRFFNPFSHYVNNHLLLCQHAAKPLSAQMKGSCTEISFSSQMQTRCLETKRCLCPAAVLDQSPRSWEAGLT